MSPAPTRLLQCTRGNSRYQREWFASVQERAAAGEPLAVVAVDTPHEVLRAMDIPYVVAPWWASLCGARGMAATYLDLLDKRGYPTDQGRYGALGFASALSDRPEEGPWGGLPKPTHFVVHGAGDEKHRIMQMWADRSGAELFTLERSNTREVPTRWWETVRDNWEATFSPRSLDLMTADVREMISWLERTTGRVFDLDRLRRVMDLSNEQGEWFARSRDLLARAPASPVGIADTIPATMIPQWHLGSEWGRDAAKAMHDEIEQLIASGASAAHDEWLRLMWIGNPLWFDMGFYERFQQEYGAVFVWSIYLGIAADGYVRRGGDPVRALASRHVSHHEQLNVTPWNSRWYAKEARWNRVAAAIHMTAGNARGNYFIRQSLEAEGVPVLEIDGDAVDGRAASPDAMAEQIGRFLTSLRPGEAR